MSLLNSSPIRFLITRASRSYGFMDPIAFLAKLRSFAQPSEVSEPVELLRAGMIFHARGLINTKAIQHNLDWAWPYWVERQFNPDDESFIPRAFSFSHINLTHRNWTAVGRPDVPFYPIVDPRGLVTPLYDGWSLDFLLVDGEDAVREPGKLDEFKQTLTLDDDNLRVRSVADWRDAQLSAEVTLEIDGHQPYCRIRLQPDATFPGEVAVALRPYNPEGVSFVERLAVAADNHGWLVNHKHPVGFDRAPDRQLLSIYHDGDALHHLDHPATAPATEVKDPVGMATAVALFSADSLRRRPLEIRVPIYDELAPKHRPTVPAVDWRPALRPLARLQISDTNTQRLYDLAVANLVLHTPRDPYPGPYTYKRFWFRDAAFMLHALLALGDVERTRRALAEFADRQRRDGYFLSQAGEWDANGEAMWIYHKFALLTGEALPEAWLNAVARGARWITRKRLPRDTGEPTAGLLPAGFSAEHLGPNDYYYWDDFWAVAGLRAAADLLQNRPRDDERDLARACGEEADEFLATIERSFPTGPKRRFPGAIPAAPRRRMDSGAIGSIVADYPLQLFPPADPRIQATTGYLLNHSMNRGGFLQNMIHSGINAYLTLHLAQVQLRAGQARAAWALMDRVAELASPTGQWPEAIHPRTGGGCMGDGQHIWAAAEWALMVRACWLREEHDHLVVGPGLRPSWWRDGAASFGPTLTRWGPVTVHVDAPAGAATTLRVSGSWRGPAPRLELAVPDHAPASRSSGNREESFPLQASNP